MYLIKKLVSVKGQSRYLGKFSDVHLDANVKVRMTLGTPSRGTNTNFYIDAKQLVHSRKINFEPRILLKFSAAILCQCFCFFWNNN